MFASAIEKVRQFTKPVIVSKRFFDGTVETGIGAFIVLNDAGWIVTAAHVVLAATEHAKHKPEIDAHKAKIAAIQANPGLSAKLKARQIARLPVNPKWVTNTSYWWFADGRELTDIKPVLAGIDVLIGRLTPFNPAECGAYPTIKNPVSMKPGTSLCRFGYPFHNVITTFDEATQRFVIPPEIFPICEFPNEGIFTRTLLGPVTLGTIQLKLIETSSPGLKGQSGGAIFDKCGNIWGIQSNTEFLSLGFPASLSIGGKTVVEHQFLNVGRGVHCEILISLLKTHSIAHSQSAD